MAKKRRHDDAPPEPPEPPEKPKAAKRTGVPFHVYLDPAIDDALRRFVASTVPKVSITSTTEAAFCEFLQSRGFWPPAAKKGGA